MSSLPPPLPVSVQSEVPAPRFARTGLVVAVLLIIASIVFLLTTNDLRRPLENTAPVRPSTIMNLMARYLFGAREMLRASHQWNAQQMKSLDRELSVIAHTPVDQFRVEIVRAVMNDRWPDTTKLKEFAKQNTELHRDVALLAQLDAHGKDMPDKDWQSLLKRHGWIAKLARAQAIGWNDTNGKAVLREASTTVAIFGVMALGAFAFFILGIVLLVMTIKGWKNGTVRAVLPSLNHGWASVLVEGFALYLFTFTVGGFKLRSAFPNLSSLAYYGIALIFIIVAAWWPRIRGMDSRMWRTTLGYHRGQGWWREMQLGVFGWISGLPLLALGAWLASIIAKATGTLPTHPIVDELQQPGAASIGMTALAVLWAPITEESMFRGLLFPGLSSFVRWIAGALLSAFVFAVIHPQGWAGVPAIMAIALTMSALRVCRGSIIASMTAHALNNGIVTAFLLLVTRF